MGENNSGIKVIKACSEIRYPVSPSEAQNKMQCATEYVLGNSLPSTPLDLETTNGKYDSSYFFRNIF